MDNRRLTNVSYTLFFLYPLIALYSALRNYRAPKARNIAWLFVIFYGLTFVISSNQLDSRRYADDLSYMYGHNFNGLDGFMELLYSSETNYVDVVQPLLTFLVSRFTNNENILFGVFGLVFGFFYTRNIWFLLDRADGRLKHQAWPFLLVAAIAIAFWQINGFRFWTAAHVFIYGFFTFLSGKKLNGFLLAMVSTLFHFSFILPVLVFFLVLFIQNRVFVLFCIYFFSFFISQVTPQVFSSYTEVLPPIFKERTNKYTSAEYLDILAVAKEKPINWYVNGRIQAIEYLINGLLIFIFIRARKIIYKRPVESTLLCFSLILGVACNIFGVVGSFIRFSYVFFVFIFSFFFLLVQNFNEIRLPAWLNYSSAIVILLFVIVEIRIGFNTMGVLTVFGNPLAIPFIENETPLIDLIR